MTTQQAGQYTIGIDLHKRFAHWHVLDQAGTCLWNGRVDANEKAVAHRVEQLPIDMKLAQAAIEPIESWGWYADLLEGFGISVHVAHTHKTKLISHNHLKNDKVDAKILAELLFKDFLPTVYRAPREMRDLRELVRTRMYFVHVRSAAKSRVRSALAKQGLICRYASIDGKRARQWLSAQELRDTHKDEVRHLLAHIEHLDEHIAQFDQRIQMQGTRDPLVTLLQTVPGIGPLRALTIKAEVGDFARFPSPEHLSAYAGLVPSSHSSGGKEKHGHITKCGSAHLRSAMVQAAQQSRPSWGALYEFYVRLAERRNTRIARVALARKLLTICWYVVRKNEPFRARFALESSGSVGTLTAARSMMHTPV